MAQVLTPSAGDKVQKNSTSLVEGQGFDPNGVVDIKLYKASGGSLVETIGHNVQVGNQGEVRNFDWQLVGYYTRTDYRVEIDDGAGGVAQSGDFTIYELFSKTLSDSISLADSWGDYTGRTYVYEIDYNQFVEFAEQDIVDAISVHVGAEDFNLLLDSNGAINKYPGTSYTSERSYIITKEFYLGKGIIKRYQFDFTGTGVNVTVFVHHIDSSGNDIVREDSKTISPNEFKGLANGKNKGRSGAFKLEDANIIRHLLFEMIMKGV